MCQFTYCTLSSTGHLRSRARPLPAERLSAITHAVQFQLGEGGVRKNYTKCTLILAHILSGALLCHLSPQHTRRKTSASRQLKTTVHHTVVSTVLAGRGVYAQPSRRLQPLLRCAKKRGKKEIHRPPQPEACNTADTQYGGLGAALRTQAAV